MENIASLSALGAAFCWAIAPLLSVSPAARLGSIGFARWRMYTALIPLSLIVLIQDSWQELSQNDVVMLGLSGVIGVFLGDTFLFASMNIVGPRRSSILFASSAAISAAMAVMFLSETISPILLLAFALVTVGTMTAIFFGKSKDNTHRWEMIQGSLPMGILFGVLAAVCQASGSILAKPAMDQGVDSVAGSALRVAFAAACHTLLRWLLPNLAKNTSSLNLATLGQVIVTSGLSMGIGMTLLLFALSNGNVSWVSILSSISPILILPILWFFFEEPPPVGAWIGAAMTVLGTGIILWKI